MDIRRLDEKTAASPQITEADLAAIKGQGFLGIINNRPDGEEPGQPRGAAIEAAAKAAGLSYTHVPLGREPLSPDHIARMRAALDDAAAGPALLYCRSGTRSTTLWALAEAQAGADPADLIAKAEAAGYDLSPYAGLMEQLRTA